MDIETGAIVALVRGSVREEGLLPAAMQGGLHAELFQRGRQVFTYLLEHHQEYGEVPPEGVVTTKFPDFELPPERPAAIAFYIDELKKRSLHNRIAEAMREAASSRKSKNPVEALAQFEKMVAGAQEDARSSQDVNLAKTSMDRWAEYIEQKGREGMEGLPSPWKVLDELTLGWKRGEFIVVTARLGTGKTWFLVLLALACHIAGFVPLVVSREMAVRQIARRLDAARAKVPHHGLRSGNLAEDHEELLHDALVAFGEEVDFWVSGDDAAMGPAGLAAKIDQLRPDIILVDGLYLLQDDMGQSGWEGITNVTRSLKRLARGKDVPVLVTTQLNRAGRGDKASTANIAYSDSVGQDADVVLALIQDEDMRLNNELRVELLKQRDGTTGGFTVQWDLARMEFACVEEDDVATWDDDEEEDEIPF